MSPTFLLPLSFVASTQEPKTGSDTPAPATPPTGPAGTPGTTATPGGQSGAAPTGPCGGSEMLIYMGVFLALMYFMVMRPEQKRRKDQQSLLSSVKVGDRVVTVGGMHGVVHKLAEKTVTVRVDTVMMTFDRVAIARVERDDAAAPPAKA
jgi:preprotein translocase subunit YajC